jgi:excisionase family DNA binding protein
MHGTMTVSDVAKAANVSRWTIYNWIETGKFTVPPIKGTKPSRWNAADVHAWLNPNTIENATG